MRGIRDWGLGIRRRRKAEGGGRKIWDLGFGIWDLPNPKPRAPNPSPLSPRSGITLLEVLVSIFILAVGLLGAAALIPIGKLALIKTNVSDRTGACGRAAMRDVEVRRMLDYRYWYPASGDNVFVIDPLGVSSGLAGALGPLPRVNMRVLPDMAALPLTPAQADAIFRWQDELTFDDPSNATGRPRGFVRDNNGVVAPFPQLPSEPALTPPLIPLNLNSGNFSWFLTVCPSPSDINQVPVGLRRNYTVSVVVCYKRDFTGGEYASLVTFPAGIGYGGGTIQVTTPAVLEHIKTDQWVMLASIDTRVAKWYRVVGVGDQYLSLVGPDWDVDTYNNPTMVVVEGVTGVYTTTVHLDAHCIWTR